MAKREDTSIRESLTRLLPPVKIRRLAVETGALKRRRKVDVACFVYSLVLGFAVGSERSIAGLRRTFERATGMNPAVIGRARTVFGLSEGFSTAVRVKKNVGTARCLRVIASLRGVVGAFSLIEVTTSSRGA